MSISISDSGCLEALKLKDTAGKEIIFLGTDGKAPTDAKWDYKTSATQGAYNAAGVNGKVTISNYTDTDGRVAFTILNNIAADLDVVWDTTGTIFDNFFSPALALADFNHYKAAGNYATGGYDDAKYVAHLKTLKLDGGSPDGTKCDVNFDVAVNLDRSVNLSSVNIG